MSNLLGLGYSIGRSTGVCAATGARLAPGDRIVAALVEREPGGPVQRVDFLQAAWESSGSRPDPARLVASWRTTVPVSDAPRATLLSDEELLDLFARLGDVDDEKRRTFRYVLALLLLRKRVLRLDSTRPAAVGRAGALRVSTRASGGTPDVLSWDVIEPRLNESGIEDAIEQLGQVLAGRADNGAPQAPATPGVAEARS